MADLFCSKTIGEILPSVRSLVANRLLEAGLTQKEVSSKLGITQPAISQYKKGLRGSMVRDMAGSETMLKYIDTLVKQTIEGKIDLNTKICEMCKVTRESGIIKLEEMDPFLCILEIAKKAI
ncbi:helix-turn-helix domain-containing protein [Candidatus Parvarchaeota archaeon]|nr:helix-turn-helix domain-containing protein [Candidatus Parvarchaeota archaeon]